MATFYPPGVPPNMPPVWSNEPMPTTKVQTPCVNCHHRLAVELIQQLRRPQNDDTEAPPPVPAHLRGQECLYGYVVTDQLLKTYWATHDPAAAPPNEYLYYSYKQNVIYDVAEHLGFDWDTPIESHPPPEDIVWFSYTKDGVVQI